MAEESNIFKLTTNIDNTENDSDIHSRRDGGIQRILSFSSEADVCDQESNTTRKDPKSQSVPDDTELPEQQAQDWCLKTNNTEELKDASPEHRLKSNQQIVNNTEDKENTAMSFTYTTSTTDNAKDEDSSARRSLHNPNETKTQQQSNTEDRDAEVVKRAQEEGCVSVVFPGTVTQDGCCRFVSEILKCILYQRQQLPMTYDQLVYSQKKQQDEGKLSRRTAQSADIDSRKCQQTLQDLEELLQQLEVLFSLSRVPRVLLLMGGSIVLPKELYEINMEALSVAGGDQCLRVSSCLRQLFRTLFVADLLSDTRPVRLMPTTVLALAHRDCGVGWFRPKLQFKIPTRVKKQIIALSTDPSISKEPKEEGSEWQDYVWFQAPMAIKGFGN